jgi:tubulin polyglutamylase TTLL2
VVQRYVANPLLLGGFKFDLRVYVLVLSYQPLQIYMHSAGLARIASESFDTAPLESLCAHLTNTSINKYSLSGPDKCKITLDELQRYFFSKGWDWKKLWSW